ncbi:hypothetical protein Gogos_020342 [Gossypium gossypioides]|uniref:Replication protein A C-terminal domain-containing protein n=1 Tax=Gossypium gossypioides TaxID=34282 RepID=A0A7J9D0V1_GOSGO|nr:hypothetical protein [Gossypium gossypioides]
MYVHLYNTNLRVRVEALVCKMTLSAFQVIFFINILRVINISFSYVFSALEIGVPSDVMARELNVSYDKIKKYLEFLVFEGLVYMTIDDHYKFTDS